MSSELQKREERYERALRAAVRKLIADGPHLSLAFSRRVKNASDSTAKIRAMSDLDLNDLMFFAALGLADAMLALWHEQEAGK